VVVISRGIDARTVARGESRIAWGADPGVTDRGEIALIAAGTAVLDVAKGVDAGGTAFELTHVAHLLRRDAATRHYPEWHDNKQAKPDHPM